MGFPAGGDLWTRASRVPSLVCADRLQKNDGSLAHHRGAPVITVPLPPPPLRSPPVQRFDETIGGRLYHIEVSAVASNRWRAQIVRAPGVPTAMMPFYGTTPDAAAGQLSAWLALAYRTAAPPVSP